MMRRRTAKVADSSSIDGSEDAFVLTGDAAGDTADDGVVEVSSIGQLTLITESHTRCNTTKDGDIALCLIHPFSL